MLSIDPCRVLAALVVIAAAAVGQEGGADTATLRGRCVDDGGAPVARAKVSLYQQNYGEWRIRLQGAAITDAEGRFSFAGVPAPSLEDRWIVLARAQGRAVALQRFAEQPSDPEGISLRLGEAATLRGTVLDSKGEPARGAVVWIGGLYWGSVIENSTFVLEPLAELQTFTDARGEFALDGLPPGAKLDVRVHHAGHVKARLMDVSASDSLRVDLEPGGAVVGRVVHEKTGEPAAGVVIQAQGANGHPDPMRAFMATRTEDDGTFRLDFMPPGAFNIWAKKAGWTVVAHDSFDVGVGENRAPDLTLVRGGWIEGVVLDAASGKPMPGVSVGMYGPARPRSGAAIESVRAASDGTFRIRAAPGANYVYLCSNDVTAQAQWVDVAAGETTEVEFRGTKGSPRR